MQGDVQINSLWIYNFEPAYVSNWTFNADEVDNVTDDTQSPIPEMIRSLLIAWSDHIVSLTRGVMIWLHYRNDPIASSTDPIMILLKTKIDWDHTS